MAGSTDIADIEEDFLINESAVADRQITFTLGAPSMLAIQFPRRRQLKLYCQWQYKSVECKYAGVLESCDRSLNGANGCVFHGNSINFGGFPGIQAQNSVQ
jgi:phage-related protein